MALNKISEKQFLHLNMTDVFTMVARETYLSSPEDFAIALRSALSDLPQLIWEGVRAHNHKAFYDELLERRKRFVRTYDILECANPHHVPPIQGETFGLAHIWFDMIESSYNDYVSMSIDKKPSDRNYDSIIQYIDLYVEIAEGHLMRAQKAKSCLYGNIKDRMLAQEKRRDKRQARIVHDSHDSISAPCSPDSDKSWFFRKKPLDFVPGVPDPPDHPAEGPPSDNPDEAHGYHTADERDFAERDPAAGEGKIHSRHTHVAIAKAWRSATNVGHMRPIPRSRFCPVVVLIQEHQGHREGDNTGLYIDKCIQRIL